MTEDLVELRLFVAGRAPNSQRARANLEAFCRLYLPERHRIEIIDVLAFPRRALEERVLLTPTLAIVSPPPIRRIVGDLSDSGALRQAVGLPQNSARPNGPR